MLEVLSFSLKLTEIQWKCIEKAIQASSIIFIRVSVDCNVLALSVLPVPLAVSGGCEHSSLPARDRYVVGCRQASPQSWLHSASSPACWGATPGEHYGYVWIFILYMSTSKPRFISTALPVGGCGVTPGCSVMWGYPDSLQPSHHNLVLPVSLFRYCPHWCFQHSPMISVPLLREAVGCAIRLEAGLHGIGRGPNSFPNTTSDGPSQSCHSPPNTKAAFITVIACDDSLCLWQGLP